MPNRTYSLSGFEGLWNEPARWFLHNLAVYFIAAVASAGIFMVGVVVYSHLSPEERTETPEMEKPIPGMIVPKVQDREPKSLDGYPAVAWGGDLLATEIVGVPIVDHNNMILGSVKDLSLDADGSASYVVIRDASGARETVIPFNAIEWQRANGGASTFERGVFDTSQANAPQD